MTLHLTQRLHRAVQQNSDGVMMIYGDRTTTFGEAAGRVARLAGALRNLVVAQGDREAILGLNSNRYVEYLLAVPWADAVVDPVNIGRRPAEMFYCLGRFQTSVLFIDDAFASMLPALRAGYPALTTVIHYGERPGPDGALSYEELIATSAPIADARRGGDQLAGRSIPAAPPAFPRE
ncbi:AMP-binding protein [Nocardia sp. NPDC055002]